jgi:hypothetical protein
MSFEQACPRARLFFHVRTLQRKNRPKGRTNRQGYDDPGGSNGAVEKLPNRICWRCHTKPNSGKALTCRD